MRAELAAERQRFGAERDRLQAQAEQARQAQTEADTAATRAITQAETRLQVITADLQQVRGQLAATQAAAGLALPPLIDVDGDPGVLLGDGTFDTVTLHNGVVEVHRDGQPIALGDPATTKAQARTLGVGLLATAAHAPTQEGDDHA
ncbi:MAG TPA: hypothetical protein VM347_16725 [Nonomuraea sp.]|nr:hypothetical protein [Nonomuraea sp.]